MDALAPLITRYNKPAAILVGADWYSRMTDRLPRRTQGLPGRDFPGKPLVICLRRIGDLNPDGITPKPH